VASARSNRRCHRAAGVTRFTMEERFSGPLLPLIDRTLPDFSPSFEKFAGGLKRRAESST